MGRGRGKTFEKELLDALRERYPDGYIERNQDRTVYGRPDLSLPSPPDLIALTGDDNYLIECKAKAGKSMPFFYSSSGPTLSEHQEEYLLNFDALSESHHGYVAINLYNNKKGRFNRAWLVPIEYYVHYMNRYPRKSISIKHLENDLPNNELIRLRGSRWQLPEWV